MTGTVVNGAFTNFVGDMEPRADLANWSCEGYNGYFALATTTEGDGVGQGHFSGWFPYVVYATYTGTPSSDAFWWQATTTHYNYLRLTDETITLQAEVDEEPMVGGNWSVWKQPTLMNRAVFPNDGTEHDASFYIAPQNQ